MWLRAWNACLQCKTAEFDSGHHKGNTDLGGAECIKRSPSGRNEEFVEEMMVARAGADRSPQIDRTIRLVICASVVCGWEGEVREGVSNASSAMLLESGDWRDEMASPEMACPERQTDVRRRQTWDSAQKCFSAASEWLIARLRVLQCSFLAHRTT